MPTYDYQCDACGHEFELFQSIREAVKRKCPECQQLKLRRLIGTGAAVVFKGSGFYQTDYRSESYKSKAKAEKESGGSEKPASSEKPAESKPASPTAADSREKPSRRKSKK